MKKFILGLFLGTSISVGAVYVEKVKINNWTESDIKRVIENCSVKDNKIEC